MSGVQVRSLLRWLFVSALLAYALLSFLKPIRSSDVWWHLKTGEHIVTNLQLPAEDPFSYPDPVPRGEWESFLLRSYWLFQSVLYLSWRVGGLVGVVVFRVVLLALTFWVVWRRLRRLGVDESISFPLLAAGLVVTAELYTGDRPQMFSFLGAAVLAGMMEDVREGRRPSRLMPPLMLLWSNAHGAFVLGDLMLALFALGTLIQCRFAWRAWRPTALWAAAGVAASLVNPCGYRAFLFATSAAGGAAGQEQIYEFITTFAAFRLGNPAVALVWAAILLTVAGLCAARKLWWPDLLLVPLLAYLSVRYLRNAAYFSVAMAPLCGYYLDRGLARLRASPGARALPGAALSLAMVAVLALSSAKLIGWGAPLRRVVYDGFPERAVEFVQRSGLAGRMFNDYEWGGYLLWRLAPAHKVFIDGRVVRPVHGDYRTIVDAVPVGRRAGGPDYKTLLERWQVDWVLQPPTQTPGNLQPLMLRLLGDPEWSPVYLDGSAYVFVRRTPRNAGVVQRYAMHRVLFATQLLQTFEAAQRMDPGNPAHALSRGETLVELRRYDAARQVLEAAARQSPGNLYVERVLRWLNSAPRPPGTDPDSRR